jgi:hypothetical protein
MNPSFRLPSLLLLGAAAVASAQSDTLSGTEIQQLWVGKEVIGRAPNGSRVIMTMSADGTARLLIGSQPDSGSWRLSETGYCATWKGLRGGQEACFTVKREGEKFHIYRADGSSNGVVEVK